MKEVLKWLKVLGISFTYLFLSSFTADFVFDFITKNHPSHFITICGIFFLLTAIAATSVLCVLCGDEE